MLQPIDKFLNNITMYKTVLFGLIVLAAFAIASAFLGTLTFSGVSMVLSLLIISVTCFVTNFICAKLWKVPMSYESWLITALILFFLFFPVSSQNDVVALVLAGAIAMASKYILAIRGKHIFNPAAFGAVVVGLTGLGAPVWWIGTAWMLPLTLIVGLLIVRKIRRFTMFAACVLASFVVVIILGFQSNMGMVESIIQHLTSWPIIFFASVMVTEPLTMPSRRTHQIIYGTLIGLISSWPISLGPIYFTPELVLVLANLYSYAHSLRRRLTLTLDEVHEIARDTYEYVFHTTPPLQFLPGQYLEWMLPHERPDARGNRRYFTIASSPTEKDIRLGVKIGASISSYKTMLKNMKKGDTLLAGQLAGDFTLPDDTSKKLVFIAGGIGITPFRSMIKYLTDTKQKRDVVLFYSNRTEKDAAYGDILKEAENSFGLKTVYLFSESSGNGAPTMFTADLLKKEVPDAKDRMFYISGPNAMVDAYKKLLTDMGVPRWHIVTDYFPGFA
jgi:ferredoxin-NADP reductase